MRKFFVTSILTAAIFGLWAFPTMAYTSVVRITPDMYKTYSPVVQQNPTQWSNVISLKGLLNSNSIPVTQTPKPVPTPVPTTTPIPPTTSPNSQLTLTQDELLIVNLVNQERVKAGLQPLKVNFKLVKIARLKAQDMADNNYFSHTSPTYGSPFDMMKAEGVGYRYAGENIAGNRTASAAMTAWMQSEGHRANILNPRFTHIGVGAAYQASPYNIYVQEFTQEG
jgi:uncharacterized YkwD family protein